MIFILLGITMLLPAIIIGCMSQNDEDIIQWMMKQPLDKIINMQTHNKFGFLLIIFGFLRGLVFHQW